MMFLSPDSPRLTRTFIAAAILAAAPCAAQKAPPPAVVQGRVIDSLVQPIPDADVSVDGTTIAVKTDSYGRFALRAVPAGAHVISVRKIGYGPIDVAVVTPRDTSLTPVVLTPGAVVLKTIVTRTVGNFGKPARLAYTGEYDDFYQRRFFNVGSAKFFTREDIDRMGVTDIRDVLRRVPHLQMWDDGGNTELRFPGCGTQGIMILDNGMQAWPPRKLTGEIGTLQQQSLAMADNGHGPVGGSTETDPLATIRSLRPEDVEGIEVYPSSSSLPVQAVGNACAAIFIWTK
jgi:hypothetical protein